MKSESILNTTLLEELERLEKIEQQEYQKRFAEIISKNDLYKSIAPEEQEELIKKAGLLALNVISTFSWILERNNYSARSLSYLRTIQESDGSLEIVPYEDLTARGLIAEDKLSIILIAILNNNNYENQKLALLRFNALPGNIDNKPYKDNYIKFCFDSIKEMMEKAINISQIKLAEAKEEEVLQKIIDDRLELAAINRKKLIDESEYKKEDKKSFVERFSGGKKKEMKNISKEKDSESFLSKKRKLDEASEIEEKPGSKVKWLAENQVNIIDNFKEFNKQNTHKLPKGNNNQPSNTKS